MGIRETLNRNPGISAGAVAGVIVLALIYIVYYWTSGSSSLPSGPSKAWYTVDDGKTFFVDSAEKVPPFDYQGKTAVLCHVFTCDGRKTKFVGYLQRYTARGKKLREDMIAKHTSVGMEELSINGIEIKPPMTGDKGWVNNSDPRAGPLATIICRQSQAIAEEVPAE